MAEDFRQEFVDELMAAARSAKKRAFPVVITDAECDTLEVLYDDSCYIARWINPGLTLYLDRDDRSKVVGVLVEGVSTLMKRDGCYPDEEE